MGLENGIILEMNTKIKYQPWFCSLELDKYDEKNNFYQYLVDFWCSGYELRMKIFEALHISSEGGGEFVLGYEDILRIINVIKNEIKYNGDFEDKCFFWHTIDNLYWVYEYMIKRPQDIIRCYFYDSY